jgi:hypothetical protein
MSYGLAAEGGVAMAIQQMIKIDEPRLSLFGVQVLMVGQGQIFDETATVAGMITVSMDSQIYHIHTKSLVCYM